MIAYPWCVERLTMPEKFIFWNGTSGLGNSMHSLVSTLLLAAATCRTLIHPMGDFFLPVTGALRVTSFDSIGDDVSSNVSTILNAVARNDKGSTSVRTTAVPCSLSATQLGYRADHLSKLLAKGTLPDPWPYCRTAVIRGNQFYAPQLLAHSNMSAFFKLVASTLTGGSYAPYFGPASRLFLQPRPTITHRVQKMVTELRNTPHRTALIGVHIRARFVESQTYDNIRSSSSSSKSSDTFAASFANRFLSCVANVRTLAQSNGFNRSRVYVAADNDLVRRGAQSSLGPDYISPPSWISDAVPTTSDEMSLAPKRTEVQNRAAFDELLVLSRMDAMVVFSMRQSTYSSVAASWFAHRAGGSQRPPGLGVFLAGSRCQHIPVHLVEAASP